MKSETKRVSLIAAEKGGYWAPWVERFRADTPDVVVVLQQVGEKLGEFSLRIRARLAELERNGISMEQSVLVGGGRTDADALSARSVAIRSMAAAMARHGGGDVTLDDAGDDRHAMAALAVTVSPLVSGTGVRVVHQSAPPLRRVA
jgi:hypothetical protein